MRPAWSVSPLQPAGRSRRARTERNPKGTRLRNQKAALQGGLMELRYGRIYTRRRSQKKPSF